jgi:hypothetical protein
MLSVHLVKCKEHKSELQLRYKEYKHEKYFSIPLYFHGVQGYYIFFDPWTGKEVAGTFDLYAKYNQHRNINRWEWKKEIEEEVEKHSAYPSICSKLSWFLKGGEEEGLTSIIHIPNIRTYAILNKKEYGGFEPMDYCPFCGAKFPERLDAKLTEILRSEYGLETWEDYKKAPHEFHTDEWWRKMGL